MTNYFNELFEKFDNLTDEQFDQLLIESGIETCPYEILEDKFYDKIDVKIKLKYNPKISVRIAGNDLMEYNTNERKKIA